MNYIFVSVVAIINIFISSTDSQKLCNFSDSAKMNISTFIHHFSSSKCMRVSGFGFSPSSKVVLDECSYWNKSTTDQQFYLNINTLGQNMLTTNAGMGERLCLTTKQTNLYNDLCQSTNFDQSWNFKPIKNQKGKFLIEQFSSKKCLVPQSSTTGTGIGLAPCNAFKTEQMWKLCY